MKTRIELTLISLAVMLAGALDSSAENNGLQGPHPCTQEISSFCSHTAPGSARIYLCLKTHDSKLSRECLRSISGKAKRFEQALSGCDEELDRYCSNVPRGKGRLLACIVDQMELLSRTCRKALDAFSW